MRASWASSLGVALGCCLTAARAEESAGSIAVARPAPMATLLPPVASLGKPVPAAPDYSGLTTVGYAPSGITPVQAMDPPPPSPPPSSVIPPVPPPPYDPILPGPAPSAAPASGGMWGNIHLQSGSFTGTGRKLFQSDHAFDDWLISPVSSPFLSQDPRALTEIRPIFMMQGTPKKNWIYNGGTNFYLGMEARLALTERFSLAVSKLGQTWLEPKNGQAYPFGDAGGGTETHSGFSELWLSPQYTFIRNDCTGTVAAAGVQFQVPTGPGRIFQDTGTLSVVPYVSAAQRFGRSSYGSFDGQGTLGYAISVDDKRSEYLFLNLHLDYDVLGMHKIYPLMELNWTCYTQAGNGIHYGFEGGDLVNYGSHAVSGSNLATLALGARYKFCEWAQIGSAIEFPLVGGNKDILAYRWTVDMIFRY